MFWGDVRNFTGLAGTCADLLGREDWRDLKYEGNARRNERGRGFGQEFDSPHLHLQNGRSMERPFRILNGHLTDGFKECAEFFGAFFAVGSFERSGKIHQFRFKTDHDFGNVFA